jgi:peptidyl-prolyl cis-trans isomerase C
VKKNYLSWGVVSALFLFSATGCRRISSLWGTVYSVMECYQENNGYAASEGRVLAQVGNLRFTEAEARFFLERNPTAYDFIKTPLGQKEWLKSIVDRKALYLLARQNGAALDPDYLVRIRSNRQNILSSTYRQNFRNTMHLNDEEVRKYFDTHPKDFPRALRILAAHIVLPTIRDARIVLDLINKGSRFDAMAKKYSTDKNTASKGGYLGVIRRGEQPHPFEKELVALKERQVSGVVYTPRGFELIYRIGSQIYKGPITDNIRHIVAEDMLDEQVEEAEKFMTIKMDDKNLQAFAMSLTSSTATSTPAVRPSRSATSPK